MRFSFRARLIALISGTIIACVLLVGWQVERNLSRSFELAADARTQLLVDRFNADFDRRGEDISRKVSTIANSEQVLRIALAAAQPQPDFAPFVNDAQNIAIGQQLDILEVLTHDGAIISSAHWPARFGYKETWISELEGGAPPLKAFLKREQLPDGETLAIVAVNKIRVRDTTIYVAGGQRLDAKYFQTLIPPYSLRPFLYRFTDTGFSVASFVELPVADDDVASGPKTPESQSPDKISAVLEEVRTAYLNHQRRLTKTVQWTSNPEDAEVIHSTVLTGRNNELLGALLIATPVREQIRLARHVRNVTFGVGGIGILFAILLSTSLAGRFTRPIQDLASAADRVAAGDWTAHVESSSSDEIGRLAAAFNHMTHELMAQREQLVQTERVAAWRELARRLAHELKNPLFPLQITIENLLRARESSPEQFDDVFRESTTTLLAELQNLKNIVGRFSDFSRMPAPQLQAVDVNSLLREVGQLFQAQFARDPVITVKTSCARDLPAVDADPVLLRRAFENLILNARDAMQQGGTLRLCTAMNEQDGRVVIEVADSGEGLTPEECERLFTPYYTTKQHGTGLGLAIVQSVIADHNGTVSVRSIKSVGTTFHIELPIRAKGSV